MPINTTVTFPKERKCLWDIRQRCNNPNDFHYLEYGERGIKVCDEWTDSKTGFGSFIEHVGPCPDDKHTIDRIENDGNYEPGNVRWASRRQQARNRRSTRDIGYNGKTQCLQAWADELGIKRRTLAQRIDVYGWSVKKAFLTKPSYIHKGVNDRNNQYTGQKVEIEGVVKALTQWADETGIQSQTIRNRIKKGITGKDLLKSTNRKAQLINH